MPRAAKKPTRTGPPLPQRGRKQTISFGMVSVPVRLKPAVEVKKPVSGHRICSDHEIQVKLQPTCGPGGHVVDEPITAYEVDGQWVQIDESDVDALASEKTGALELTRVVEPGAIAPFYLGKAYLVYPDPDASDMAAHAFDTLTAALRDGGKVGIGTMVLAKQTRMVALYWEQVAEVLLAHECQFDSYVRWVDVDLITAAANARPAPTAAEVQMASLLLQSLEGDFDPEEVEDDYYPALQLLLEAAAQGKPKPKPKKAAAAAEPVNDLMAALTASVDAAQARASIDVTTLGGAKKTPAKKRVKA